MHLGEVGAKVLSVMLRSLKNLEVLSLKGQKASQLVAQVVAECVCVSENGIGADGAKALAEGLKSMTSLHTLDLESENG